MLIKSIIFSLVTESVSSICYPVYWCPSSESLFLSSRSSKRPDYIALEGVFLQPPFFFFFISLKFILQKTALEHSEIEIVLEKQFRLFV